jgi:monofunctional glycosyltransferase
MTVAKKPRLWSWRGMWRLFFRLIVIFIVTSLLLVLALRFIDPPTSAFMLARAWDARVAGEKDFRLRQSWQDIENMSRSLPVAMMAAEDQRFPDHHGFDLVEIRKAIDARGGRKSPRGASTISQQVAKNLFLWSGRSYVRKGLEVWFTGLIELTWPKHRILEVYLNIAEFGDGVYGAEAAAQRYFGVSAQRINSAQAARMAAVLPNPKKFLVAKPSAYVLQRQRWIERQMRQLGGTAVTDRLLL